MNGSLHLADTNAILYLLCGNPCMECFLDILLCISTITKMELLGFPELSHSDEIKIRNLLQHCTEIPLNDDIEEMTIQLRRTYKIKLPDAIIASTAIVHALPLISADLVFSKIKELILIQIKP